ncbi:hypothetical protein V4Y02_23400, partial [Escherichia coli]
CIKKKKKNQSPPVDNWSTSVVLGHTGQLVKLRGGGEGKEKKCKAARQSNKQASKPPSPPQIKEKRKPII